MHAAALGKVFAHNCMEGRRILEKGSGAAERHLERSILKWAEEELEWCDRNGVRAIPICSEEYPYRLRECCDAPLILYCRGGISLNPARALAVVGTRKSTWSGRNACQQVVGELSRLTPPPVIVSGLAFGIDATAHNAALEAGIPTIAVSPCGLDSIYPAAHRDLAGRIIAAGAIVTDFPRQTPPQVANFLRRNRIIAGMADATLLAESYAKGGGLITTSLANSYDREVFAFPGRVSDASFAGCNAIIASNQAHLATGARDIAPLMGWELPSGGRRGKHGVLPFPEEGERGRIMALLKRDSPLDFEQILERSGLPFSTLSTLLVELELNGSIVTLQGRRYAPAR